PRRPATATGTRRTSCGARRTVSPRRATCLRAQCRRTRAARSPHATQLARAGDRGRTGDPVLDKVHATLAADCRGGPHPRTAGLDRATAAWPALTVSEAVCER